MALTATQSVLSSNALQKMVKRFRVRTLREVMHRWHQRNVQRHQLWTLASRGELRLKKKIWVQMRRRVHEIVYRRTEEKLRENVVQVSALSRKLVGLTSLTTQIRSNHRLAIAKAFNALKLSSALPQPKNLHVASKLRNMCQSLDKALTRQVLLRKAFTAFALRAGPAYSVQQPESNHSQILLLVQRVHEVVVKRQLRATFAVIRDQGRERHLQLERAALYKDFQAQLLSFKTCYEELKSHCDTVEKNNQDLLQELSLLRESSSSELKKSNESYERQIVALKLTLSKAEHERTQTSAELEDIREGYE